MISILDYLVGFATGYLLCLSIMYYNKWRNGE